MAAYVAALANKPAEQAAELARRAVAAGARTLPEPGEPPWFPIAIVALFWAERYDEAQVSEPELQGRLGRAGFPAE